MQAVDNLSLNFYSNEVCAFLGHNGCGKTTTINMLTGVVRPDAGTCTVDGASVLTDKGLAYIRSITGAFLMTMDKMDALTVRSLLCDD